MDGSDGVDAQCRAVAFERPGCGGCPFAPVAGAVFEVAVLDEFGVQSPVGSVVYVFEEHSYELLTDGFPLCGVDGQVHVDTAQSGKALRVLFRPFVVEAVSVCLVVCIAVQALHVGPSHAQDVAFLRLAFHVSLLQGYVLACLDDVRPLGTDEISLPLPFQQVG